MFSNAIELATGSLIVEQHSITSLQEAAPGQIFVGAPKGMDIRA